MSRSQPTLIDEEGEEVEGRNRLGSPAISPRSPRSRSSDSVGASSPASASATASASASGAAGSGTGIGAMRPIRGFANNVISAANTVEGTAVFR